MDIVTLLDELVKGLFEAEEKFFDNLKDFNTLEKAVKSSTEAFAAGFLGKVLSDINDRICGSSWRDGCYSIQRHDTRTLISSVGDVSFKCTYFKRLRGNGGYAYLLEDMIGLDRHERFTEEAEALMLAEALKTSYAEAAGVLPSKQEITKTTVMNKIHRLAEEMPHEAAEDLRKAEYLYVGADEDHVAEQHGNGQKANGSFMSKLVYVHEGRKDAAGHSRRKELENIFYFGGLYPDSGGNEKLWENVREYIDRTYDGGCLKRVFVSGDGAPWIRAGTDYLDKALFCADKYHLMKYINAAAGQMADEKEASKAELWHLLYSKKPKAKERFDEYTDGMMRSAAKPEKVDDLRKYVLGNRAAVRRTLRNKLAEGCSAEGHVSHVLSARLSSRPMGWSRRGADRMSKLRCYERNHGREGIINLVKYGREQRRLTATGTDNCIAEAVSLREIRAEHYDRARSYIDRIQAHIPGLTARKAASIRTQLKLIS